MFWLGGFPALEVTTSTPDALCPPIEEARAAIEARVGEVRGDYHAEFALVRAIDGRQVLELVVLEGQQQVLTRELPLDGAGCQDAAQAIALVLERFFDAVEKPAVASSASASNQEPIPVRLDEPPVRSSSSALARDTATIPAAPPTARAWRARGGFSYDRHLGSAPTLGLALFPSALQLRRELELGIALEVSPFLSSLKEDVRGQEIRASTLQTALSVPLNWRFDPWSASLGPWAQLRFQRAEGASLAHGQVAYRTVFGFGAVAQLAWSPAPRWTIGLGTALGSQAAGASARFVLREADGGSKPVLVPESWFGQGELTLALEL